MLKIWKMPHTSDLADQVCLKICQLYLTTVKVSAQSNSKPRVMEEEITKRLWLEQRLNLEEEMERGITNSVTSCSYWVATKTPMP